MLKSQAEDNDVSVEQQELEKQAADEVEKAVESINQKVGGWAYAISKQKYDAMVVMPQDLLKPEESQ